MSKRDYERIEPTYKANLEKKIAEKQKELDDIQAEFLKEKDTKKWFELSQRRNNISVDIATLRSRIANYGKEGIALPDAQNQHLINSFKR